LIFVTVGTQLPFDRLVKAVDDWAASRGIKDVVAQAGQSKLDAAAIRTFPAAPQAQIEEYERAAQLIVGHAGIGTILAAAELGKPLIIMPRRRCFGEHRNDHQLATADRFRERPGIYVAMSAEELHALLDGRDALAPAPESEPIGSPELIQALREFLGTGAGA